MIATQNSNAFISAQRMEGQKINYSATIQFNISLILATISNALEKEAPGEYEAYADMGLNEWIKLKIEVEGTKARLFLNNNKEPSLVVIDLKHGADLSGAIALWVDVGTEGFFSNVKVYKNE